ncbi:hypothetical protein [Streptomyces sp. NPDC059916]|uniref:hypothetical protein n=1 Tax=Streptomyces sp. NPDC059916 TaxID=3347001 RepID=UPI0036CC57DE
MDLHTWITKRVADAEAIACAELERCRVAFAVGGVRTITGTITAASQGSDGLNLSVAQYGVEPRDAQPAPLQSTSSALRRCESDRRILAAHHSIDDGYSVACEGCGYDGSYCPEPITMNINDCPMLLALAHAHGITPEILAELDRAQLPKREAPEPGSLGHFVPQVWSGQLLASLRDVPAPLRGPNWKAAD